MRLEPGFRFPFFLLLGLFLGSAGCGQGDASSADTPVVQRIANLDWLAGTWRGPGFEGIAEEQWLAPEGGSMVGAFRLVAAGRPRVVELLTILEEEEGIVYRFNHFTPQLKRWERETQPLLYRLTELTASAAVFESPAPAEQAPSRISYRLRDPSTLEITLEFPQDDSDEAVPPIELVLHRQ